MKTNHIGQKILSYISKSQVIKNGKVPKMEQPKRNFLSIQENSPLWNTESLVPQGEYRQFMSVFPVILKDLVDNERVAPVPAFQSHLKKILLNLGPTGRKLRSCLWIAAYKSFEQGRLTCESMQLVYIMGWILEIGPKFGFITDDIIDGSKMRHGCPCWHTREDIGLKAISDAYFMHSGAVDLFSKYFSNHPQYTLMREQYFDVFRKTLEAQISDTLICKEKPKFHIYTMKNYNRFAKEKTGIFFHLPLKLALLLADIQKEEIVEKVNSFCDEMAIFHQVQNDFWDVYGDVSVTGKEGTDIQEGKFTWLIAKALQEGNYYQNRILLDCYGKSDSEAVAAVRSVYDEINLVEAYGNYEEESFKRIRSCVTQIPQLSHELFHKIADYVFKRNQNS